MQLHQLPFAFLLLLTLLFHIVPATAQKTETYYDASWKPCKPDIACYFSTLEKTDSGYYRHDFFTNGAKLQMMALFEDSACKIQNGNGAFYYANGYPQRMVRMIHNKPEGIDLRFHNNGLMSDSGNYHNGLQMGNAYRWHYNGTIADSIAQISDSLYVHVSWFDDGAPAEAGREINGKKNGLWNFYYHNGNKAATEIYESGKLKNSKYFDEAGKEIPVDTTRYEHAAEFKGGVEKWTSYLGKALIWPGNYKLENVNAVIIRVEMTIDEQGNITDVYVVNPFHPAFDKIAYDAISKGPKWKPAIQHNRPVKYRFVQSVTFAQQ